MPRRARKPSPSSPDRRPRRAGKPSEARKPPEACTTAAQPERDRDAARKRASREAQRVVHIPKPEDLRRRRRLEQDVPAWLRHYFPHKYTEPFTEQQLDRIQVLLAGATRGGDQAIAAPRGDGKSTDVEGIAILTILTGIQTFVVIFAATATDAQQMLENIKEELETNDLLAADYPEVCTPIRALEHAPSRARQQTVSGQAGRKRFDRHPSSFQWCGRQITFPCVPESRAAGAILATRGLDGSIRGLNVKGRRPTWAILDDPDTEHTAASEEQADKLVRKIDRTIAGLAGQRRRLARTMLTTIQSTISVSARYTDPRQKPSWDGRRYKLLVTPPGREDLWDEYCQLRQADQSTGDPEARQAHAFYLKHRKAMDAGAVLGNPHRYDDTQLPDKTRREVSALQRCYNLIADIGLEAFQTEYQNDPPAEEGPIESGITAYRVQRQLSGYDRKVVPPGCTVLVQGIDVRKIALHFVVRAFRPDCTSYIVDYGVHEVLGTLRGSDEGLERALIAALRDRVYFTRSHPYADLAGNSVPVDLTLIDAGWQTETIYHFCRTDGGLDIKPAMGFGRSAGCAQANFTPVQRATRDKKPGDGWAMLRRPRGVWLVATDTDRWKRFEHARWMTATDRPGTTFLFGQPSPTDRLGPDEKSHFSISKHLTAEIETEELVRGVLNRRWKSKSDTNHYLDASYMTQVAAAINGIRLLTDAAATRPSEWFKAQEEKHRTRRRPTPKKQQDKSPPPKKWMR